MQLKGTTEKGQPSPSSQSQRITWNEYYNILKDWVVKHPETFENIKESLKESNGPNEYNLEVKEGKYPVGVVCIPKGLRFEDENMIDCSQIVFNTLDIRIPAQEMRDYYKRFGIIVHRTPGKKKLIIGCGNLGHLLPNLAVSHIDELNRDKSQHYRSKHGHEDSDTLDSNFAKNPTIVAIFGDQDLTKLFDTHKYELIIIEGMPITGMREPFMTQQLHSLLADGGKVEIMSGGFSGTFTKNDLYIMLQKGTNILDTIYGPIK